MKIFLEAQVRGIKKLVWKCNFWSNCRKASVSAGLLQERSWQEHHKLWQNIKYAQAAKCKPTQQGLTTAAVRGRRIAYLNLIHANITKGSIFIIHGSAHNAPPLPFPFLFPPLVNIDEVYIRNKINLFLGILQSAFEMWYSPYNDVELLHDCIKWDKYRDVLKKEMDWN